MKCKIESRWHIGRIRKVNQYVIQLKNHEFIIEDSIPNKKYRKKHIYYFFHKKKSSERERLGRSCFFGKMNKFDKKKELYKLLFIRGFGL